MENKDFKTCPYCGEEIRATAIKCRHCLSMLDSLPQKGGGVGEDKKPLKEILENKKSPYPKAPLLKRFAAYIVDVIIGGIFFFVLIPAVIVMGIVGTGPLVSYGYSYHMSWHNAAPLFGMTIILILIIGVIWSLLYFLLKDGFNGASLGKRLLGLMVIDLKKDNPAAMGVSALRNFINYALNFIPYVGWLVEPVMVLAHEKGQRLGDLAANSQVVEKDLYQGSLKRENYPKDENSS